MTARYSYKRQQQHIKRQRPSRWECFKRACQVWVEAFVWALSPQGAAL